jgi:chemotaxis protein MotB
VGAIVVAVIVAAAAGAFLALHYLPLRAERDALRRALQEQERTEQLLEASRAELAAVTRDRDAARAQLESVADERDELRREQQETEAALRELERSMEAEIAAGDILVRRRGGEVAVDIGSRILFRSGSAELSDHGREVLARVAQTLATLEHRVIDVAGHTDSQRPSRRLQEQFPTNWELSTARATNVVRYLQDECSIPGDRLAATGFAQYRPTSTNRTTRGRRLNRRIELLLRPRPSRER